MAKKYIDADLLWKEIESRMGDCDANSKNPNQLLWAELAALIPFIDSLQQEQPLPEDTVLFNKGVAEGRRLERQDMLKDAVEGEVCKDHIVTEKPFYFYQSRLIELPDNLKEAFDDERVLFVSISNNPRVNKATAMTRNKYVVDMSENILFGMFTESSSLYEVYQYAIEKNKKMLRI